MNSYLQVIVNKFEALGIAGEGFAWVEYVWKKILILEPLD
jgi:hypothetical protein